MESETNADVVRLRIYLNERQRVHGKPLYEFLVHEARRMHIAGATVVRGVLGFGARSHWHVASVLSLSDDLPVVIDLVDTREKLDAFVPTVRDHLEDGIATIEPVTVVARAPV